MRVSLSSGHTRPECPSAGAREERITSGRGKSLGIIDIHDGLIRWVEVKKQRWIEHDDHGASRWNIWYIEYGVPDSRITARYQHVKSSIEIEAYPDPGCWILTVEIDDSESEVLPQSKKDWDRLQEMARDCLATPIPTFSGDWHGLWWR